jgi:NAD(P)-dependent dehydrogenase (short-subunit alcohol dehydrogenase family)
VTTHLITGAGSGVGAALARRLAARDVVLALADRGPEHELHEVAELCRRSGAEVLTGSLDVCDETAIADFVEAATRKSDRLDFVFANAGIVHAAGDDGLSTGTARELMDTNYFGAVNTLAPAARIMSQQNYGTLVAIASISALVATHGSGAYSASKAALTMWTDSLRLSLRGTNVRVTNIILGFVDTPMTQGMAHAERLWIDADAAAAQIIKAARDGAAIASVPWLRNSPWWLLRGMPHALRSSLLARAYRHFNQAPDVVHD